ncbi:hypothetical protein [Nocardia takedensis]|uniref:hypothetical protein n=1 Tax=Nocardia takedensis TaxID=259390 RepID=UPI000304513B|nr:hypothetical protein [Nocardia takedensis]
MRRTTFEIPLSPRDYDLLTTQAAIRNQAVPELTRELLTDALHRTLDPDEIERRLDHERQRLLTAARRLRDRTQHTDNPDPDTPLPDPTG